VGAGTIANSLIVRAVFPDRVEPLLALTSGAHRPAHPAHFATLVSASEVGRPIRRQAAHRPGDRRGRAGRPPGACPEAHAKSVFPTTFDELLALTGGNAADVAANGQDIHP
jgi:hypothetical protein